MTLEIRKFSISRLWYVRKIIYFNNHHLCLFYLFLYFSFVITQSTHLKQKENMQTLFLRWQSLKSNRRSKLAKNFKLCIKANTFSSI